MSNSLEPKDSAHQASLSFSISWSLLKLMSIELVMLPNHLILCCLLLLPSVFLYIKVFTNELALCVRWLEYWSFSICPSNDYSRLISFRIDGFDLLTVQGTLKSLLQHFSYCSWGSCSKNTRATCHSLLSVLSELLTMTHPSWAALHDMAYSFIELPKPIHQDKVMICEETETLR